MTYSIAMLKEADLLVRRGLPPGTPPGRIYFLARYAVDEAASAVLVRFGMEVPQTLARKITTFVQHATEPTAAVPVAEAEVLMDLMALGPTPDLAEAYEQYNRAHEFLLAVSDAYFDEMRSEIPPLPEEAGAERP